jgi:Zn-dependent protease with chaperone function
MRFRQQQDDARQATHRLLGLFVLLLAGLVIAVNVALVAMWWLIAGLVGGWFVGGFAELPPLFIETNTALVLLFVIGGCLVELGRLREGGGVHVAEWAGGRLLTDPRDVTERRLLNIVDEMTLASGLPRPTVFVLHREDAINAFAAGWTAEASVIAVTRGALERLTRDELQGLVAHEFGHIHQDDLRLNMVLLALVWGLSLVHGYGLSLMEADESGRRSAFGLLVGSVFVVAGSLGWLAGQLLQAAVSRQRELLADACAVQFTRGRDGLGGTLRKVWHQVLKREDKLRQVPGSMLAAMLLQAPPSWLATHPPLPERLRRIYGRAMEPLPAPMLNNADDAEPMPGNLRPSTLPATEFAQAPVAYAVPMSNAVPPSPSPAPSPAPSPLPSDAGMPRASISDDEREAVDRLSRINGPGELRATILALLLTPGSQREKRAWRDETKGLSTADGLRREIKKLGPALRLPWLDELLSRIANAPMADRQALMEATRRVMAADGQVRPIDRLHWLAMRHRLGERPPVNTSASAQNDMTQLPESMQRQVATLTAFLSRVIPDGEAEAGGAWYRSVLGPWMSDYALPPCEPPDADGLATALAGVQALPWMLKPVLARAWLDAARRQSPQGRLSDDSADALRLACLLLESPMPPELARHYIEPAAK